MSMIDRHGGYDPDEAPLAGAGLFGLPFSVDEASLVIVPVPWDVTTSYRAGTADGPEAVRMASHQLDLYDPDLGEPWRAGIAMLELPAAIRDLGRTVRTDAEAVIATGGRIASGDVRLSACLERVNAACARLNGHVRETVTGLRARGKVVGLLGGDHSTPYGAIRAVADTVPDFGVLQVDAHADLRAGYEGFEWSHASILFNVLRDVPQVSRLVQVGVRDLAAREAARIRDEPDRIRLFAGPALDRERFLGRTWDDLCAEIVAELPQRVYVTFDIDGLDPSCCPNTGTPVPGGLSFPEARHLLRSVVESGRTIIGFDLNEVAPSPDGRDEWDANVGARVLYQLCGWTLKSLGLLTES